MVEIGSKLKEARIRTGLTQEAAAEAIRVSRQTISNWENERSYPDIVSVIRLGELYHVSLDELLKGDGRMLKHLEESTNVVTSNRQLLIAVLLNVVLLLASILCSGFLPEKNLFFAAVFSLSLVSISFLFYQIIRRI